MPAVTLSDLIKEFASKENPLFLDICTKVNSSLTVVSRLQDVVKVARILDTYHCNNDITFPADFALPISIRMNGALLYSEVSGYKVLAHQYKVIKRLCEDRTIEVSVYFDKGKSIYTLGEDACIKEIARR